MATRACRLGGDECAWLFLDGEEENGGAMIAGRAAMVEVRCVVQIIIEGCEGVLSDAASVLPLRPSTWSIVRRECPEGMPIWRSIMGESMRVDQCTPCL